MRGFALSLALVAGCRLNFAESEPVIDPQPDASGDGPAMATTVDCANPPRFPLATAGITSLTVAPTSSGFVVLAVDASARTTGVAYDWAGSSLVATTNPTVIGGNSTQTSADAIGDTVLIATGDTTSTTLTPVTNQLAPAGAPQNVPAVAIDRAIVAAAGGAVFASVAASGAIVGQRVSPAGVPIGGPIELIAASEMAASVSLQRAGNNFVLAWRNAANEARLAVLDPQLTTIAGPVIASLSGNAVGIPRASHAAASDRILVAWYEKRGSADDVWTAMFDAQLAVVAPAAVTRLDAVFPQVVSDGSEFYVGWLDQTTGSTLLGSARVDAAGGTTLLPSFATSGGQVAQWSLVARASQAVVAWTETNGSGPNLWFQGICR